MTDATRNRTIFLLGRIHAATDCTSRQFLAEILSQECYPNAEVVRRLALGHRIDAHVSEIRMWLGLPRFDEASMPRWMES